jgi:hypothetical protein
MTTVLADYFYALLHPFRLQRTYREQNNLAPTLQLAGPAAEPQKSYLSFPESISISWGFVLLQAILIIASLPLGNYLISETMNSFEFEQPIVMNIASRWQLITVFFLLFEAIFFPAFIWFYTKLWGILIRFFGNIFQIENVTEKSLEQIMSVAITGHAFLIIPVFGSMIKHVSLLVYLFAGLRENLGMTRAQSLMVLVSPIFVLTLFCLIVFLYLLILFSTI